MLNYCTLFDSNYLSRGLAMYRSLQENSKDYHLFILAFDNKSYEILIKLSLINVTVVSLIEFEDEQLLEIKKTRTSQEYCWTCTPSIILYCINKYVLKMCTYIDADILFYSDPKILLEEMDNSSVLITEHHYTTDYIRTSTSGRYCVQFMAFKNDLNGIKVLNCWRQACLDWCYARYEDGKFGDQMYLDNWTTQFEGVHELQHLGGGVAPWNVQQYKIFKKDKMLYGIDLKSKLVFKLIFYHFHQVKFFKNNIVSLSRYAFTQQQKKLLYKNYIQRLELAKKDISNIDSTIDPHGANVDWDGAVYTLKDYPILYLKNIIGGFLKVLKNALLFSHIRKIIKTYNHYKIKKFIKQ